MKLVVALLYCYFVVFCFGQLTRVSWHLPEINIHLADIAVGLLVLAWIGWKLVNRDKFILPSLAKYIFLFFLLTLISLVINSVGVLDGREMFVSWLYLLRWGFYAGIYFVVYDLVGKNRNWISVIRNWLIAIGLVTALLGLAQYLFLPDMRFLEADGWDPHYYRLIGTFLDPGFLGMILVLTLSILTFKLWSFAKSFPKTYMAMWIVCYLALALTYSRASYLGYLAGMGTIAWFKKSPKFFLAVLVAGLVTVLLLPRPGGEGVRLERESTIRFRVINWEQSLTIAKEHLLFGVGFNAYRYTQREYGFLEFANWRVSHAGGGADSSLLFVLATTGVFGFLTYLWFWGKTLFSSVKTSSVVLAASVIALLVHSFFVNSLFYPWIMAWMWILLGINDEKIN